MQHYYNHYRPLDRLFNDANLFRVDVQEKDNGYQIHADLPGVAKEDVNIDVRKDTLIVGAKFVRESGKDGKNAESALINERFNGEAKRSFRLSQDIDAEAIDAEMKDGVLTLFLPKKKEAEKRRITIR